MCARACDSRSKSEQFILTHLIVITHNLHTFCKRCLRMNVAAVSNVMDIYVRFAVHKRQHVQINIPIGTISRVIFKKNLHLR